jgi:hypothetical protein
MFTFRILESIWKTKEDSGAVGGNVVFVEICLEFVVFVSLLVS